MSESPPNVARMDEFLPDWSERRLVVLDSSHRWAPAVSAEVNAILERNSAFSGRKPVFESCETPREALLLCEARNTIGAVLFVSGMERECLSILGRMARWPTRPALLAVCTDEHRDLMPMLMESGIDAVLFNVTNDIAIAEWCSHLLVLQCSQ